MKTFALFLLLSLPLLAAGDALIVADEFPAMEVLAARLKTGAGVASTIVKQTEMPADLSRYSTVIVYIHGRLAEPAEKAFIDYATAGGRLILVHHSISTGKRANRFWFPFLGVTLPLGELSDGGYAYFEEIEMEIVNLAPKNFITTNQVKYDGTIAYRDKELPAFELKDTEVYLNQVSTGEKIVLLGFKFREAKSGVTYTQDTAGWYKKAGRGLVMYFMPGHSVTEFQNPAYAQILVNAVSFQP